MNKKKTLGKVSGIVAAVVSAVILLFIFVFLAMLIAVSSGLIRLIFCVVSLISVLTVLLTKSRIHLALSSALFVLAAPLLAFTLLWAPFVHSNTPWKYGLQRRYIDMYNRASSKDFPDALPDNIAEYEFDYIPSILQGTGHCSARFEASAAVISDYLNEYATRAIYTVPLSDFESGTAYVDTVSPKAKQSFEDDKSLDVWIDREFWADTDATVYVLSAVHNWNHPHSSAVIISDDCTKIQFTQLG